MKYITARPYEIVQDKIFSSVVTFRINADDLNGVEFEGGQFVYSFIGCKFNEIIIENEDIIEFKEVNIYFADCFINKITVSNIRADNVSIAFGNTVMSGKIDSDKLVTVAFNNVIINSGLFLMNQNLVNIYYTEENIFLDSWEKVLGYSRVKTYDELLKTKQSFYIDDSKVVYFKTNHASDGKSGVIENDFGPGSTRKRCQLTKEQKESMNLNVSLSYSKQVEKSEVKISKSFLNSLSIDGDFNGKLNVESSTIQSLYIREFSVKGEATFFNINPLNKADDSSKLEIRQSNLDNTWFDNIAFSSYKTVSFYRTKFSKAKFSSCDFPVDYTSFESFRL